MSGENIKTADVYFDAINKHDLAALSKVISPVVHFSSPIGDSHDRDSFLAIIEKMFPLLKEVHVRARFASDNRVFCLYDMIFNPPLGRTPTANMMTFVEGKIKMIEVIYDARPFESFVAQKMNV